MTTTFHGVLLGLGLLAIWAWLAISLTKIKFGVVTSERARCRFNIETKLVRVVMTLSLAFSLALLVGSYIRIVRGV